MAIKFDDLAKVATGVHNDGFHTSGLQLKTTQKTSFQNIVLSSQVDLFSGKDATPAKLTWKWPKPLGFKKVFIDKLELDKSGKFKLETSSSDVYPGLMLELKSDLVDVSKVHGCWRVMDVVHMVRTGFTYTDYKETQVKFECNATNPKDFTCETTYAKDKATFGVKLNSSILKGGAPDFGVRYLSGPFFCALMAKEAFKAYSASVMYTANKDFKLAGTYQHGGKASGNFTLGLAYKGMAKLKIDQSQTVTCAYKHSVSKGFTFLGGVSHNMAKADTKVGLQLSIE